MKKINYNRTTKEINDKKSWFSIHCTQIERTLFKTQWDGRNAINYPYTIPNGYKIKISYIYIIWKNYIKILKQYQV